MTTKISEVAVYINVCADLYVAQAEEILWKVFKCFVFIISIWTVELCPKSYFMEVSVTLTFDHPILISTTLSPGWWNSLQAFKNEMEVRL